MKEGKHFPPGPVVRDGAVCLPPACGENNVSVQARQIIFRPYFEIQDPLEVYGFLRKAKNDKEGTKKKKKSGAVFLPCGRLST